MTRRTLRRRHPLALMLIALAAMVAFELAVDLLRYALLLVLPAAVWLACRRWHRRRACALPDQPQPPLHLAHGTADPRLVDDLRRQVAKLEDDASRHERIVEHLEDVAGRPITAIIAGYRLRQAQYGPAAVGKPGRPR
jgi:hypothetical protein